MTNILISLLDLKYKSKKSPMFTIPRPFERGLGAMRSASVTNPILVQNSTEGVRLIRHNSRYDVSTEGIATRLLPIAVAQLTN